jgi:hypothetical protein
MDIRASSGIRTQAPVFGGEKTVYNLYCGATVISGSYMNTLAEIWLYYTQEFHYGCETAEPRQLVQEDNKRQV